MEEKECPTYRKGKCTGKNCKFLHKVLCGNNQEAHKF